MKRTTLWAVVLALWAVFAIGGTATAGTVGKVTGRVVDAKGEALPGANVVLEGTRRGATTDATGTYVILSVDPGVYSATASLIGFHSITKKEVRVQADFTTTVDFRLQEKAVELSEVVVTAERPPVEPDKTESRYVVTAKDIEQVPILRNVTEFVALEAGVAKDGSGVIRSGEISDNAYYVDGVRLQNNDARGFTSQSQWSGVNVRAIQEISIVTGGMNAEYGNAQAGVVNMVTRDGSEKYHGEFEYRLTPAGQKHWGANVYEAPELRGNAKWNNPDWVAEVDPVTGRLAHQRLNYTDWRGHYFDGYLSGPLTRSAYFFVSARTTRDAAVLPGPWKTTPPNLRTSAKLTFPIGSNVKLRFGWVYERWEEFISGAQGGTAPTISSVLKGSGRDIFLPAGSPAGKNLNTENAYYAVLTHTLSPKTFYELRISHYQSKQDTSGVSNTTSPAIRTDKGGWFYLGWDRVLTYTLGEQKRTGVKFDLSSQATKGHFVKSGIDFTAYDNFFTKRGNQPGDKRKDIFYLGDGEPGKPIKPKQFAFYLQDKMEFQGLVVNAGLRYDRFWGVDVPLIGGYRALWYNTMSRFLKAPLFSMRPIVNYSPRLGISHPITSRSSLHFFYGHFYQVPSFHNMFHDQWYTTTSVTGIPGVPYSEYTATYRPSSTAALRPIWDKTQRTISFEVGSDWNFVSDYTVALAAFDKSASFQETGGSSGLYDPATGQMLAISSYANTYNEDIRGFEFSLRKGFSRYFSFRAAFNLEWAELGPGGGGDIAGGETILPDSTFVASGRYFTKWEVKDGVERPVPLTEKEIREIGAKANAAIQKLQIKPQDFVHGATFPGKPYKAWEQSWLSDAEKEAAKGLWLVTWHQPGDRLTRGRRGQGSLQVFFSSPPDFGPGQKVMGSTLLGNLNANLIYRIYTGSPFNYTTVDAKAGKARGPLHTVVDLNVQKRLSFGRLNADLFLEVHNLFNQKDAASSQSEYMWWGLQTPPPDDANYKQYGDFSDRTRYLDRPRYSNVGIRFSF